MVKTTKDYYHRPDCDSDLLRMVGDKAKQRTELVHELEAEGYDPCPNCYPERANDGAV